MERPTKEIKLPTSGSTAKIVTFFTRGEAKGMKNSWTQGKKMKYVNDDVVIDEIPANYRQLDEDALLLAGIRSIIDKTGVDVPVSAEVIDSLPDKDTALLLFELQKVQASVEKEKKD